MRAIAVTFIDEQAEICDGELVNPFRIENGVIHVEKESGGPFTVLSLAADGESFIIQDIPRQRIASIRAI
jgi:hypothetical protein